VADTGPPGERQEPLFWNLSEALIVSALTGFAYCLLYSFDCGLTARFAVPIQYVTVNTSQLIALAIALVIILGFPAVILAHMPSLLLHSLFVRIKVRLLFVLMAYICACVSLLVAFPGRIPWLVFAAGGFIEGLVFLVFYARRSKKGSPPATRLLLGLSMDEFYNAPTRVVMLFYGVNLALALLPLSFMVGLQISRNQTFFPVIQDGDLRQYVVVWSANDDLLFAERFDPKTRTLTSDVALVRVNKEHPLRWRLIRLGKIGSENSIENIAP